MRCVWGCDEPHVWVGTAHGSHEHHGDDVRTLTHKHKDRPDAHDMQHTHSTHSTQHTCD